MEKSVRLDEAVSLVKTKLLNPSALSLYGGIISNAPILVVLSAGKGNRFGPAPKCIQPIYRKPLARHTIDAFRQISPSPVICIVGYCYEEVASALGNDNIYVRSENPTGGTAHATFEALSVPLLQEVNPLLVITMGDRIVPPAVYRQLWETHQGEEPLRKKQLRDVQLRKESRRDLRISNGDPQGAKDEVLDAKQVVGTMDQKEAELTLLTAQYDPPRNQGKGRILRDQSGTIITIREQRDIEAEPNPAVRRRHLGVTEGNCPLYMIRARTLHARLSSLKNENAQKQYYITDIVADIAKDGGTIRSITTTPADAAYALLCADITYPDDLPRLEKIVAETRECF